MIQTGMECLFLETMYVFPILNFGHCDLFGICDLEFPACLPPSGGFIRVRRVIGNGF